MDQSFAEATMRKLRELEAENERLRRRVRELERNRNDDDFSDWLRRFDNQQRKPRWVCAK